MEKENKEMEEYNIWHSFVPSLGDQGGTGSHPGGRKILGGALSLLVFITGTSFHLFFSAICPQERLVGTERGAG